MFGQKITNTNEMLQCRTCYYADFALSKSGQLNEALIDSEETEDEEVAHSHSGWHWHACLAIGKC
jgi:hypothetical protein